MGRCVCDGWRQGTNFLGVRAPYTGSNNGSVGGSPVPIPVQRGMGGGGKAERARRSVGAVVGAGVGRGNVEASPGSAASTVVAGGAGGGSRGHSGKGGRKGRNYTAHGAQQHFSGILRNDKPLSRRQREAFGGDGGWSGGKGGRRLRSRSQYNSGTQPLTRKRLLQIRRKIKQQGVGALHAEFQRIDASDGRWSSFLSSDLWAPNRNRFRAPLQTSVCAVWSA